MKTKAILHVFVENSKEEMKLKVVLKGLKISFIITYDSLWLWIYKNCIHSVIYDLSSFIPDTFIKRVQELAYWTGLHWGLLCCGRVWYTIIEMTCLSYVHY